MFRLVRCLAFVLVMLGLSSAASAACVTQLIAYGATVNAVLTTDDCVDHNANGLDYYYDYYEFDGVAGQQILITSTSTAIDPDLLLIYPDNMNVIYNDDSGGSSNARIPIDSGFFTLPATGKFHIQEVLHNARLSGLGREEQR